MNTKMLLAALGGAITSFLLGWLVFGIALRAVYASQMIEYTDLTKNPPLLWAIFFGGLCFATLLAWVFEKAAVRTVQQGFTYAAIIFFLITLGFDLYLYANMNLFRITFIPMDVILGSLFGGVLGSVVAWIMNRGKKEVAAT
jgi:cytochrome bd-type quinol oxidase subunit 2